MTRLSESALEIPGLLPSGYVLRHASDVEGEVLALFDRFRGPLLRYICTFGIPVSDAEDLIQDIFLALFTHLRRGGSRANLQGWLFRVAHNMALKHRARVRRQAVLSARLPDVIADPADDPEGTCVHRQRQARLRAVFEALPPRDRRCLQLRSDGLRYREIAGVLGISLGGVAKSLARTLQRLTRADMR